MKRSATQLRGGTNAEFFLERESHFYYRAQHRRSVNIYICKEICRSHTLPLKALAVVAHAVTAVGVDAQEQRARIEWSPVKTIKGCAQQVVEAGHIPLVRQRSLAGKVNLDVSRCCGRRRR
jgi:hypothetical protein